MIKSMTAYGRASLESDLGLFVVELHSVNRKMLDITAALPKELLRFDIEIRKWIAESLERGQVTIRLIFEARETGKVKEEWITARLAAAKHFWGQVATQLGLDASKEVNLKFLLDRALETEGAGSTMDEASVLPLLKQILEHGLSQLLEMKIREGGILALDLEKRLLQIEEWIAIIDQRREEPVKKYKKKIEERLQDWFSIENELKERVGKEVALLSEKMDVTEELVRLRSHIQQFFEIIRSNSKKSVGRTLDFLAQEMGREINTLGVKAQDTEIVQYVIKIKSELEKIREQVQNIE